MLIVLGLPLADGRRTERQGQVSGYSFIAKSSGNGQSYEKSERPPFHVVVSDASCWTSGPLASLPKHCSLEVCRTCDNCSGRRGTRDAAQSHTKKLRPIAVNAPKKVKHSRSNYDAF